MSLSWGNSLSLSWREVPPKTILICFCQYPGVLLIYVCLGFLDHRGSVNSDHEATWKVTCGYGFLELVKKFLLPSAKMKADMLQFHLQPIGRFLSCPTHTLCGALGTPGLPGGFPGRYPTLGRLHIVFPEPWIPLILNMKAQGFRGSADTLSTEDVILGTSWGSFQSNVLTPPGTKVAQSKVLNTFFSVLTEATFHALKMDLPSKYRQKSVGIKSSCFRVCGGFPDSLLLCQFGKAVYNEYFYFVSPSAVTPVRSVVMLPSQTSWQKWKPGAPS